MAASLTLSFDGFSNDIVGVSTVPCRWAPLRDVSGCSSSECGTDLGPFMKKVLLLLSIEKFIILGVDVLVFKTEHMIFFQRFQRVQQVNLYAYLQNHCWRCGNIFCSQCVKTRTPLVEMNSGQPVPVCRTCWKDVRVLTSPDTE